MHRITERLLSVPLTVLGAITITFLILHLTPGDPAEIMLGDYATPERVQALRARLGLDQPLPVQYVTYLGAVARGDFGRSLATGENVIEEIMNVLPHTGALAVASILVSIIVGIPLGVMAAVNRNRFADYATMFASLFGISMPIFVFGFLMLFVFSYQLRWFPLIGVGDAGNFPDMLWHLVLPALVLGLSSAALIARSTRSSVLDVLSKDYLRTAHAKGLGANTVLWKHAFRNALIPVITILGIQLGILLGGTVVTEMVFSRQGIGKLLVDGILARDYPRVQGIVAIFALLVIVVNLITDFAYSVIDPRVE